VSFRHRQGDGRRPLAGFDALLGTRRPMRRFGGALVRRVRAALRDRQQGGFAGKVAQTLGSTLGLVTEALATGGQAAAANAKGRGSGEVIGGHVAHGLRAMLVPSALASKQTAEEVAARTAAAPPTRSRRAWPPTSRPRWAG
jgi:hypothetical protein